MIINISLLTNILQTLSKVANDKKACLSESKAPQILLRQPNKYSLLRSIKYI